MAGARQVARALVGAMLCTLALAGCGGATFQSFRFGSRGESIERCEPTPRPASDAAPAIVSGDHRVLGTRARDGLESWGHMLFVSEGGRTLLTTRGQRVFDVDVAAAGLRARYDVGLDHVRLAAITDDASMLAVVGSAGDEARLRVIRTADGRAVIDAPTRTDTLRLAATLPRVVVDDGVWDLATGAPLWRAPADCADTEGGSCTVVPLASGAGAMELRALGRGRSTVEVTYFDGRAGAQATFDSPIRLHPELDPPIVTTVGRSVRGFLVADPSTPTFAFELDGDVRSVIIAPESGAAVVETEPTARVPDPWLRVIELASGAERFRVGSGYWPARVVAGSLVIRRADTIDRHDLATGEPRSSIPARYGVVSRDGWMVTDRGAVGDPEGRVRAEGAPPREYIEMISRDGAWRMLQDHRIVGDEACLRVLAGYDHSAFGASDGRLFISSNRDDGGMTTIDLARAAPIRSIRASMLGDIFPLPLADAFVFQGEGNDHDDELVVVDASSGEVRRRVQAPRHGYRVVGGDPVPASASEYPGHLWDPHPLEIAGERVIIQLHIGRTIDLWDLTRDRSSDHLDAELEVAQSDVSDDGTLLAMGSDEGEVRILRFAPAPRALARFALSSPITALRVAPDGERLAVATRDGRLRVVVIASAEVSAELDFDARHDWVTALTWRGDERLVAFTEREAIVQIGR